jgi:competence protein ComEC
MLKLIVWDVRAGSAALIVTPEGKTMLIDLGIGQIDGAPDFSPLNHLRTKYHHDHFDWVTITHPHKDHINDILALKDFGVGTLSCPAYLTQDVVYTARLKNENDDVAKGENNALFEAYEAFVRTCPLQLTAVKCVLSNDFGGAAVQQFCSRAQDSAELNDHSIVTVVSYANCKLLLPGDNMRDSWKLLLAADGFKEALQGTNVLLAPHHGRKSAFYTKLFDHIAPQLTIISDGPLKKTSAIDQYSSKSSGMQVHHRHTGEEDTRPCVTTTQDGVIVVEVAQKPDGTASPYVRIGKKS